MEKLLNQILSEIKSIDGRLGNLEERHQSLDSRLDNLEEGQEELKKGQKDIKETLKHNMTLIIHNFTNIRKEVRIVTFNLKSDIDLLFKEVEGVKRQNNRLNK